MKTTIIVILSLILIAGGIGCAALSNYVTPAEIDRGAVEYVVAADVAESEDYGGYPNLVKANKLKEDVDIAHTVNQFDLQHLLQKDTLDYSIHKDVVATNVVVSQQREEMLFGETGLLSLGLSMAGMGTLTGFLGLMRKRPGDVTSAELQQTVAEATGSTFEELDEKQTQFVQLVSGVSKFMETLKDSPAVLASMKHIFNETQDTETQIAVSEVKLSV